MIIWSCCVTIQTDLILTGVFCHYVACDLCNFGALYGQCDDYASHFIGILGLGENSTAMGFNGVWWGLSAPLRANPLSLGHHTASTSSSTSSIATVSFKAASGTTLLPYWGCSGVTLFMPGHSLGSTSPSSSSSSSLTLTAISHTGCRLSTTLVTTFPHLTISCPLHCQHTHFRYHKQWVWASGGWSHWGREWRATHRCVWVSALSTFLLKANVLDSDLPALDVFAVWGYMIASAWLVILTPPGDGLLVFVIPPVYCDLYAVVCNISSRCQASLSNNPHPQYDNLNFPSYTQTKGQFLEVNLLPTPSPQVLRLQGSFLLVYNCLHLLIPDARVHFTVQLLFISLTNTVWNNGRWWPRQELWLFMFVCLTPLPITTGQGEAAAHSAIRAGDVPGDDNPWRRFVSPAISCSTSVRASGMPSVALTLLAISCPTGWPTRLAATTCLWGICQLFNLLFLRGVGHSQPCDLVSQLQRPALLH